MGDDKLKQIVQRMIDAGEPEENIGAVIKAYNAQAASGSPKPESKPATTPTPSAVPTGQDIPPNLINEVGKGAGKGLLDTLAGAGQMMSKIPGVGTVTNALGNTIGGAVGQALYGQQALPAANDQSFAQVHKDLAPTNMPQTIGKTAANIGTMFLMPEGGIPAQMAAAGVLSGAQSGGDLKSMALAAGLAGTGGVFGKAATSEAKAIREGEAAKVAGPMVTKAFKGEVPAGVRQDRTALLASYLKRFGLTGGPKDLEAINAAPEALQPELHALSDMLSKPRQFGHIWSLLSSGQGLGSAILGGGAGAALGGPVGGGLGVALPLAAMSTAAKYPMQTANGLEMAAQLAGRAGQAISGLPGGIHVDPLTQALLDQENK